MEFFAKSISENITVHISDSQKGENTLFFIHGYLETLYIWEEFRSLFTDYRTVAIDLPGHGISSTNDTVNSIDMCANVIRDVMDICNINSAIVCGHSMGGVIAQNFCRLHPQRCKALILFGSSPYCDSEEKKLSRLNNIKMIENGLIMNLAATMIPKMYDKSNLRKFDNKIIETIELCETHDPNGIIASTKGMIGRDDYSVFLKNWNKPTYCFYGQQDPFLNDETRKQMMIDFPQFKHILILTASHNMFIEDAQYVRNLMSVL